MSLGGDVVDQPFLVLAAVVDAYLITYLRSVHMIYLISPHLI